MIRTPRFVLFALCAFVSAPVALADVAGRATVIDGDTIEIRGQRIRLDAIDAPESAQLCEENGQKWRCGQQAALALADLIGTGTVTCADRGADRYGRTLAICYLGDLDLNGWLVLQGWALAYKQYSLEYVAQEEAARAALRGMWQGRFVPPWEWRKGVRLADTTPDSPDTCMIKGNIARSGERIYHVPGGRWYDRTKINTAKGERWFCTEEEAREAGWRPAKQ